MNFILFSDCYGRKPLLGPINITASASMRSRGSWFYWLTLMCVVSCPLRSDDGIEVGMSREAVVRAFGEPPSRMWNGTKSVLIYPQLRVVLQEERVASFTWLVSPEKRRALRPQSPAPRAADKKSAPAAPRNGSAAMPRGPQTASKAIDAPRPARAIAAIPVKTAARAEKAVQPAPSGMAMAVLGVGGVAFFVLAAGWWAKRRLVGMPEVDMLRTMPPRSAPSQNDADDLATAVERATREARVSSNLPPPITPPGDLTIELMRRLEWKRLEELVAGYFSATGVRAALTCVGADGGIDVKLYRAGEAQPYGYVQCKAWLGRDAGVSVVRELFGVMAADQISEGALVTIGEFSEQAREFARGKPIRLIDGAEFLRLFGLLPAAARSKIVAHVTRGDYTTPTCARCDVKMVLRKAERNAFWGCPHFPRCESKIYVRAV